MSASPTPATSGSRTSRVFSSTVAQGVIRVLIMLAGLISVSLLTRMLGVSGYGAYSTIMIYLSFFASLSDWGITLAVTRDIAKKPESASALIHTVLVGRLLLCLPTIALAVGLGLVIYPHAPDVQTGIMIYSLTLATNVIIGTLASIFQTELRLEIAAFGELVARAFTLLGILYAMSHHLGLMFVVIVGVGGGIVQAIALWSLLKNKSILHGSFDRRLFKSLLLASLPLGIVITLNSIYFKVDGFILSLMKPIADVGVYGAAYKVLELALVFPSLFGATILPLLSANAVDHERLRQSLQKGFNFMIVLSLPIFAGGYIMSSQIIHLIGGAGFEAASLPLRILLASLIFTSINILYGLTIIALDRQKRMLWISISGLIINIILNIIFIPHFSYAAAAANTLLSEIYVMIANQWLLRRFCGFTPSLKSLGRTILATLVMAGALMLIRSWPLIVVVPVGALVYGGSLLLFRAISPREVRELVGR